MKKLLIATHNPAKFTELSLLLKELVPDVPFSSLSDIGITEDVEEDRKTYKENAVKKAQFYAAISGLHTIADDGGIEIDYLGGAPGIKSKRWLSEKGSTDDKLIDYMLKTLENVPEKKRRARMVVAVAFSTSKGKMYISQSAVKGIVANKAYGGIKWSGFPYRQLLFIPEIGKYYNDCDMTKDECLRYNHRRKAILKLIPKIISACSK